MARRGFSECEYGYSNTRRPASSQICGKCFIRVWRPPPMRGTRVWSRCGKLLAHGDFLRQRRDASQMRPAALLLHCSPGESNCVHQDLYGDLAFRLQVAVPPWESGGDFTAGEFVLTGR
jgi:uncharacterized protein